MRSLRSFGPAARGVSWKLGSDLLGRVLQYLLLWVAARQLDRGAFGDFTFALSVGFMLSQVADFGLQLYVQRELAKLVIPGATAKPYFTDEDAAARLVGGGLAIKVALSLISVGLIVLAVVLTPVGNKVPVVLVGLSLVLATGLEYLAYCFRALRVLKNESLAFVFGRLINVLLGAGLLYSGAGVGGLALAANVAMIAALVYSYSLLSLYLQPIWRPDWLYWRVSILQPTAMGLGTVFSILAFRADNLLIPVLVAPQNASDALGLYNAAYKLFEVSLVVPSVILAAVFPAIALAASLRASDPGALRSLLGRTIALLFLIGVAVAAVLGFGAAPLLRALYGDLFAGAVPVLQTLAVGCATMFTSYGLTYYLIALDKPHLYATYTLSALALNVTANLLLIPAYGIEGAAIATLLTEALLVILCGITVVLTVRQLPRGGQIAADTSIEASIDTSVEIMT